MEDSFTENEEESINPCPPEWLDNEDNALLRGDAIGDTVYTHRWVLKCLFTITEGLPKYLNADAFKPKDAKSCNSSSTSDKETTEEAPESDEIEESDSSLNENKILELDSDVEDAACQLWDMTVEKDVSLHLLNLEDMDILQLASLIFDESCAPRLTEVMVGVVANFCCGEDGCNRLLKKEEPETLLSALRLLGSTSDVPTLCELMRLIRLLLYHRINRTPNTSWASCPLLKLLCQEQYRSIISFLLHNSLSDALISNVLELLSNFLFICLPETGLNVASLYSSEEVINGLIGIAEKRRHKKHLDEDEKKILYFVITCLYAFIDTPGARIIQLSASKVGSKLESILLAYIELQGRVESPEELTEEICDKVIRVIGLSQLLIPTMRLPTLLLTVGKLLALIYGETQQYSVSRSHSKEEEEDICDSETDSEPLSFMNGKCRRRKRKSIEEVKNSCPETPVSNPLVEDSGWLSPPAPSVGIIVNVDSESVSLRDRVTFTPDEVGKELEHEKTSFNRLERKSRDKSISVSSLSSSDLKELKDQLEDFCYQLIAYWWSDSKGIERKRYKESQEVIIDVLDQCHAHEVYLILNAVRLKDSNLVPKLQEQILDSGSHQRLVALLAHMYQ